MAISLPASGRNGVGFIFSVEGPVGIGAGHSQLSWIAV